MQLVQVLFTLHTVGSQACLLHLLSSCLYWGTSKHVWIADRFAANKAAAKAAEKAAKQADTAKRREEVQQKFAEMTEEERKVWRSERQAKRQNRKSETGEKRLRLQQASQPEYICIAAGLHWSLAMHHTSCVTAARDMMLSLLTKRMQTRENGTSGTAVMSCAQH